MKKIILIIIVAIIVALGIGAYFYFSSPPSQPPELMPPTEKVGQCGDNICDKIEKANPNACPADCLYVQSSQPPKSSSASAAISPPPSGSSSSNSSKQSPSSAAVPSSRSSNEVTKDSKTLNENSPFGFHPGNANNYAYIKDLGSFWSREGGYLRWEWVDANRNGNFKFTKATAPAIKELSVPSLEINYDEQWLNVPKNINIVANVCPFAAGGKFLNSKELLAYKDFVKKAVERYDGDEDYGCALQSPDCYHKGDSQYPNYKVIDTFKKNPIRYWQVCNQLNETCNGRDCPQTYAEKYAEVQETTYKAVKEADGVASVLIAGDSQKEQYPDVFKELGGKYIDIIDFHRFGNNYNPKEDFDYLKSSLRSAGFDTSKLKFWMTEAGTYSGDPSSDPGQKSSVFKRETAGGSSS